MSAGPSGCMAYEIWPFIGRPGVHVILFEEWEDFGVAMKELENRAGKSWSSISSWTIRFRRPREILAASRIGESQGWEDDLNSGKYTNAALVTENIGENQFDMFDSAGSV